MRKHGNAVKTGFVALDRRLKGLRNSELVVLAGRPCMGKTALAFDIVSNAARQTTKPTAVVVFSLELGRKAVMDRMIAAQARVSLHEVRNGLFRRERWAGITKAAAALSEAPIYINDMERLTPASMLSQAKRLSAELSKKGERIGLVVVDHLQLLSDGRSGRRTGNSDRGAEVGRIARQLKGLAAELRVPVLVLAQISRRKDKSSHRPGPEDLDAPIFDCADVVALIHREGYYSQVDAADADKAELIVAKNPRGKTGTVALRFSKELASFSS